MSEAPTFFHALVVPVRRTRALKTLLDNFICPFPSHRPVPSFVLFEIKLGPPSPILSVMVEMAQLALRMAPAFARLIIYHTTYLHSRVTDILQTLAAGHPPSPFV